MQVNFVLSIYLSGFNQVERGFTHLEDAVTIARKLMDQEEKNGHPKFVNAKPIKFGDLKWKNPEGAYFEISKTY